MFRSRLVCSKTKASFELRERLRLGKDLASFSIETEQDLERAEQAFSIWFLQNEAILLALFDSPEAVREFGARTTQSYPSRDDLPGKVRLFRREVRAMVDKLETLLALLPELQEHPDAKIRVARPAREIQVVLVEGEAFGRSVRIEHYLESLQLRFQHVQAPLEELLERFQAFRNVRAVVISLAEHHPSDAAVVSLELVQRVHLTLGFFAATIGTSGVCVVTETNPMPALIRVPWEGVEVIPCDTKGVWHAQLIRFLQRRGLSFQVQLSL